MISILLSVFAIGFCIFILNKFNSLKREFRGTITREFRDNYVVLPKLKKLPNYNDVDPNNKTLRDILKSMDIENWTLDHYNCDYGGHCYSYVFNLSNPQKSLRITTRLRSYDETLSISNGELRLVGFHVNSDTGTISYEENESNKDVSILIKQYLWKIVCDKNQDEYDEQFSHYQKVKNAIDKELKTLRREETLLNILGNEQR
jgi:hypothetical protein